MDSRQAQSDRMVTSPETISLRKAKGDHTILTTLQEREINEQHTEASVRSTADGPYPSGWRLYIVLVALLFGPLLWLSTIPSSGW